MKRYSPVSAWQAALLLVCTAAFCLIALISLGIFERVPHVEDEAAYLFQAQVFALGRLSVPTPPFPESYWSPFVVDYGGQRFGKYPPGYPLLLSLGVRLGAPWAVNALLGALTLWCLAHLGRAIYSPGVGLLAAALGLTCPVFLAESGTLLSQPTALFFATLFLWALARLLDPPPVLGKRLARGGWSESLPQPGQFLAGYATLAGLALGYLALTRPYDALAVGLPFAAYILLRSLCGDWRLLRQGIVVASVVLLFGLALVAYWYALTGGLINPYRLIWPYDRPGFGPDVGVEGHTLATGLFHTRLNLRALAMGFLGWPELLNVAFLWVPFVLRPRQSWNYLLLAGFVSVVALHAAYWYYGGHDAGFPRYYYAALPTLLLLTARGIELAVDALHRFCLRVGRMRVLGQLVSLPMLARPDTRLAVLSKLPVYLALVGLVAYNGLAFLPLHLGTFHGKYGVSAAPLQVARDAGLSNALVFITPYQHWHDFAVFFAANSPTLDSDVVYAIYRSPSQAQAVRALHPERRCYLQHQNQLVVCPF